MINQDEELNNVICKWIKEPSHKYLEEVMFNRLDLCYSYGIYWIALYHRQVSYIFPIYINGERAWISLLCIELTSSEIQALFDFILSSNKGITRLSFKTTEMDPANSWGLVLEKKSSAWFLNLDGSFNALLKRSSAKTRYDIRHNKKCLEKILGQIYVKAYTKSNIPKEILEQYLFLKCQLYKIPNNEGSVEKMLNNAKLDITHVYVLCSEEGKNIAIQLNSEHGKLACLVNMTYDLMYKHMSPGRLLYVEVLKILVEKGCILLYLGSGNEWYKKLFGALETNYWVGDAFRDLKSMEKVLKSEEA